MKRNHSLQGGFTLIELLVVIAIIALLLSILLPALRIAKETGQRVLCGSHLRTLGSANEIYANEHDGAFVPIRDNTSSQVWWIQNAAFRAIWAIDDYKAGTTTSMQFMFPEKYLCPTDKISRDPANALDGVLGSYGYNATDYTWTALIGSSLDYAGYKAPDLKVPAQRLAFTDGVDWWVTWDGADYRRAWDEIGQASIRDYKDHDPRVDAPVIYRHNEGANVVFYDAHVEYLKKEEIFVANDFESDPQVPGMWSVDLRVFKRYHR